MVLWILVAPDVPSADDGSSAPDSLPRTLAGTNVLPDADPIHVGLLGVPAEACSLAASLGFTVVHTFELQAGKFTSVEKYVATAEAYLDSANSHNLKVLTGLPRHWLREAREDLTRRAVRSLREHPALLAWYEEENAQQGHMEATLFANEIVRQEDPVHGLVISEAVRDKRLADVGRARVFSYYPVTPRARRIKKLRTLEERFPVKELRTTFWPVLQSYGDNLIAGYESPRFLTPTRPELMYTLYSALIAGAEAIFFYPYLHATTYRQDLQDRGVWPFCDYKPLPELAPDVWLAVRATADEARILLQLKSRTTGLRDVEGVPRPIESAAWNLPDGTLVLVANPTFSPQSVDLPIPNGARTHRRLLRTGFSEARALTGDVLRVEVSGPGGVALLFSATSAGAFGER